MNSVTVVGRTGKDPEVKYFDSGKVRTSFSVAVNRWDSASKSEVTDWYNIDVWDKQAEFVGEYVKKGRLVAIDGRLSVNHWTGQDGEENTRYVVIANNVRLLGSKNDNNNQGA